MSEEKLLRKQVIRLAHKNQELRKHLLPLVAAEAKAEDDDEKESRYEEGPMSPAEKKKLFKDNPEFEEAHEKYKDKIKRMALKAALARR